MTSRVPTVAITGMNARPDNPGPGLAVARCLRAAYGNAVRILALGYDATNPGLYQKHLCDAGYLVPYPSSGEAELYGRIAAIHENDPIDVFIPCLDAELFTSIRLAERLDDLGIRSFLPNNEQLRMRNKDRLPELATIAGIQCPKTRSVTDASFFSGRQADEWRFPLVVKGVLYDAEVVRNPGEATAALRRVAAAWGYPVLVQDYLEGEECNLTAIGDGEGNMLGAVMMKKHAVTEKGKAWAGICTSDQRLHEAARALVAALRWRGPLEVEMKRDAQGEYHLIEINPRFPAWIYLSHAVGRNLPYALVELALGRGIVPLPEPKVGTLFVRYAEELIVSLNEFESIVVSGTTVQREADEANAATPVA